MRKWIPTLTLAFALSAAFPATAATLSIAGANSALVPTRGITQPYLVNWTTFDLDANSSVLFLQPQNVRLLSPVEIGGAGVINVSGFNLVLMNPGRISIPGSISAGSISLANAESLAGPITPASDALHWVSGISIASLRGPGGDISLSGPVGNVSLRGPGGDISLISFSVPEPATPWLVLTLLPILTLLGRKHT